MRREHLSLLRCPACKGVLTLSAQREQEGRVETGALTCAACIREYPVLRYIPRFVPLENYASGFGLEWTRHARTQYDSDSGISQSRERFFSETRWPAQLMGERILEAGSGSGRFTEHAAATGATVCSLDYSYAVEANYASNGRKPNVLIVQGDIYAMPFAYASFDRAFCFGVLQHTPHPYRAFRSLVRYVKPGGPIAIDIYKKTVGQYLLSTKYAVRPLTKRLPPEQLYRLVRLWVNGLWPVAGVVRRVPKVGVSLNWRLLIADYSRLGLSGPQLREWAVLDTFDMLAPAYDIPERLPVVRRWFERAGLTEIDVHYGWNGIEGRGKVKS